MLNAARNVIFKMIKKYRNKESKCQIVSVLILLKKTACTDVGQE